MSFRRPRSAPEILAQMLAVIRLGIYVVYCVALLCLGLRLAHDARRPAAPLASKALGAGHVILADDLRTPETAALVRHSLRQGVEANKPITAAMVSTDPVAPLASAIAVIVNMADTDRLKGGIVNGMAVRVTSNGQTIIDTGTVLDTACDAQTCSILIGLPATPKFDPAALLGAQVTAAPPAAKGKTP